MRKFFIDTYGYSKCKEPINKLGNYPLIARIGMLLYNPLNKLVRRIWEKMRRNRDLLLILLAFFLTTIISATAPKVIGIDWSLPLDVVFKAMLLPVFVPLILLVVVSYLIYRGVGKIETKIDEQELERDKKLVNDTVDKALNDLGIKR
jgi:uncharacterized membrane protein YoaT (DUF817 family)